MKYLFLSLFLSVVGLQATTAQEDVGVEEVKSIFFGGGSYYVDPVQVRELYEFMEAIPGLEYCEIEIQSFTDNIGSVEYNQMLSRARSEMVLRKILATDFPKEQITVQDFGEVAPVYDNSTLQGRLHNRRVDVIIKRIIQ
ncbi:MAG: OmpA family protein [Bacteroidota bacterium]